MTAPIYHLIPNAPKPVAPYSHVVEADGWLFVTGQLATDPSDDSLPLLGTVASKRVGAGVVPDIAAVAAKPAELDIVAVLVAAVFKDKDQLALALHPRRQMIDPAASA